MNDLKAWQKNALHINLSLTINEYGYEDYIANILEKCAFKYKKALNKEALCCITSNLLKGYLDNKPIMIPGRNKVWVGYKRSGLCDWASLKRVNTILNVLLDMDIIDKVNGVYTKDDRFIAKYWLKDGNLPSSLKKCIVADTINKIPLTKHIQVRDVDGMVIPIMEVKSNKRKVTKMENGIKKINRFIEKQDITFEIDMAKTDEDKFFENMLIFANFINDNEVVISIEGNKIDKCYRREEVSKERKVRKVRLEGKEGSYSIEEYSIYDSVEKIWKVKHLYVLVPFGTPKVVKPTNTIGLQRFQNSTFFVSGIIKNKSIYRVFNRGSFDFGGRFYGAPWINLPKSIREQFKINGEPVTRADFEAIHPNLLYHKQGIEFEGEPYVYPRNDPNNRNRMKLVSLILINADSSYTGTYALNKKLKSAGLYESSNATQKLIRAFKKYHNKISQYLFSDIGVELQKIDSDVIYAVLIELRKRKIPTLSIHDEILVPEQYGDIAKKVMKDCYKEIVGYDIIVE